MLNAGNTQPDVNVEEILSTLDVDTPHTLANRDHSAAAAGALSPLAGALLL